MKTITKLAVASLLALSAAAPALAVEPEGQTLLERNTYLYTPDARPIAAHQDNVQVRFHQGRDAMAQAPLVHEQVSGQYYNERNIQ